MKMIWHDFFRGYKMGAIFNIFSFLLAGVTYLILAVIFSHFSITAPKNNYAILAILFLLWFSFITWMIWAKYRRISKRENISVTKGLMIGGYSFGAVTVPVAGILLIAYFIYRFFTVGWM